MELIAVTADNLWQESICCASSGKKDDVQTLSKKNWLLERFADGLVFTRCNVSGKAFIEYLPAENAWCPVDAEGWMFINCLWVSGSNKGQGYSRLLLDSCISDSRAKGKRGLAVLSSQKKKSFLSDPKYLRHQGFIPADEAPNGYVLMALPSSEGMTLPCFRPCVRAGTIPAPGFVLYYTHQCPFNAKYVPLIERMAGERGVSFRSERITSKEQAQSLPVPFSTYSLFYDGRLVASEILSEKKFEGLLTSLHLFEKTP